MKAIIDGKRYDTASAELILGWDNSYPKSDFKYRSKRLYKTKKKSYFIHHQGNAMTDVAERVGDGMGPGSKIEPVSNRDAFAFLCSHDGEEIAENLFPEWIDDA